MTNKCEFKIGDDVYFILKEFSPPELPVKFSIPNICIGQIQKITYYYETTRIRYIDVKTTFSKDLFRLTKSRIYLTFNSTKKAALKTISKEFSNNINKIEKLNILNNYLGNMHTMYEDFNDDDVLGESQKSNKIIPQELFIVTKSSPKFKLYLKRLIIKYNNKYYHAIDQNHYQLDPELNYNDIKPFIEEFTSINLNQI
jgi:hypothetical protein